MLMNLVPFSAFATSIVSIINLTIAEPELGAALPLTASLPEKASTEVLGVKWSPSDETFRENCDYTVSVEIGIKKGLDKAFAAADKMSVKVNGVKTKDVQKNGENIIVKYTWKLTADEPNTSVSAKSGFDDVKADAYYANAVKWAVDRQITAGTSETTFSPEDTCTRAQILTFLWRAVGSPKKDGFTVFNDVRTADYYYNAAMWSREKDMVSGNNFEPNTPCTRAYTVIYLWKNAGSPETEVSDTFADVDINSGYAQAVAWAVKNGVTSGTSETTFSPDDTCTRGQIVTFLNRALSSSGNENPTETAKPTATPKPTATVKPTATATPEPTATAATTPKPTATTTPDVTTKPDTATGTDTSAALEEMEKDLQTEKKYDTAKYEAAVQKALREALGDNMGSDMTQLQKALLLHDWLLLNCQYDETTARKNAHSEYGAIVEGLAVCDGYTRAYNDLLSRVGIEAEYVLGFLGKVSMNSLHAWSRVTIDGKKYHVDVTADDPVPDVYGRVEHTYFMVSDEKLTEHYSYTKHCKDTKYDNNQMLRGYIARFIWDDRIKKFYYVDMTEVKTTSDFSESLKPSNAQNGGKPTSVLMTADGKYICFFKPSNYTSEYPMYLYCIETGEYYTYTVKGINNIIFDRLAQNGSNIEPSRDYYKSGIYYMTKADASIPLPKSTRKRFATFDQNYSGGKVTSCEYLNDYWTNIGGSLDDIERKGYTFGGWYTAKDGGTKVESLEELKVDNVTLYAHWWTPWTMTEEPTLTESGKAVRTLDGYPDVKEEMTLPVLTDTSVWKRTMNVAPSPTQPGKQVYTSEYGKVIIILPKTEMTYEYGISYKNGSVYITVVKEDTYTVVCEKIENGEVVNSGKRNVIVNGAGEYGVIYPKGFDPSGTVKVTLYDSEMNALCSAEYEIN